MSYREIAGQFGLTYCSACGDARSHERGFVTGNTIHWRERRLLRVGLRRFLILVSYTRFALSDANRADELHARNAWASRMAKAMLHIRIPARYADADRAKARWLIHRHKLEVDAATRLWTRKEHE